MSAQLMHTLVTIDLNVCLFISMSQAGIVSKPLHISSNYFHHVVAHRFSFLHLNRITEVRW